MPTAPTPAPAPPYTDAELANPPWRMVEATLLATARVVRKAYDVRLQPLGLTLTEARLLAHAHEVGPETQTQLADRLGITRAAAGQLVDRLEQRGLVERRPHPDDRRVWLIATTRAAQAVYDEIEGIGGVLHADLLRGIKRDARRQMVHTLLSLQDNVAAVLADADVHITQRGPVEEP